MFFSFEFSLFPLASNVVNRRNAGHEHFDTVLMSRKCAGNGRQKSFSFLHWQSFFVIRDGCYDSYLVLVLGDRRGRRNTLGGFRISLNEAKQAQTR